MEEKTILITGGSSGIGAEAARALRGQGARVIITGRSKDTERIAREIGADFYLVDFAKLKDVKLFAQSILEKYPRIDVLANNVGGVFKDRRVTEDGHEMTFQVNHLAGFYLTELLRERLEASKAVVINTSSGANNGGTIDLGDLENAKSFSPFRAYCRAKLMNILHAQEITRRYKGVSGVSFHPGVVATGFARQGGTAVRWLYESFVKNLFMISPQKGADTLVWLATTEPQKDWQPGEYYAKRKPARRNRQSRDPQLAQRLWEESAKLVEKL